MIAKIEVLVDHAGFVSIDDFSFPALFSCTVGL